MNAHDAARLLAGLSIGDTWQPEHDAACRALDLDPDNYRARADGEPNAEGWPPELRGTVVTRPTTHPYAMKRLAALLTPSQKEPS